MSQLRDQRVLAIGTGAMGQATARLAAGQGAVVTVAGRDRQRLAAVAAGLGVASAVGNVEVPEQAVALLRGSVPFDHVAVLAGGTGARASSLVDTLLLRRCCLRTPVGVLPGAPGRRRSAGPRRFGDPAVGQQQSPTGCWAGRVGALHGAIEALARSAVLKLSPIRVNTVSPGGIGIGMDRQFTRHQGAGEDIAAAVVALMTNPAITGALLDVDGGERLGTFNDPA